MVWAAPAKKTPDERIMLKLAKVEEALATKHPSDDQIEQDPINGKEGIARLGARKTLKSLRKLNLFKVG